MFYILYTARGHKPTPRELHKQLFATVKVAFCLFAMSDSLRKLPDDLLIGFATSSHQIEGGSNEGKGEDIWNRFERTSGRIEDGSNADVACDSYHKYKEDVQLLKNLGSQFYRFSLSWSRILPNGFSHSVNQKGIDYYNNLIDELLKNGIQPMVTLFHWDLPQPLQDLGGWTNPILADFFADYARVAFTAFGDRVKIWLTFNEPFEFCFLGYGLDIYAPSLNMSGTADYLAGHTVLIAHAKAYHLYDKEFRPKQNGEISITVSANWSEPKTNNPDDVKAAEDRLQFTIGWFTHPIFSKEGDYPEAMKRKIAERSKEEGFSRSRLPEFEKDMIEYIRGTGDFFGINFYTTRLVSTKDPASVDTSKIPSFERDLNVQEHTDPSWKRLSFWLFEVPWGFRKSLKWIKDQYNNPKTYITENGCSDAAPVEDTTRVNYYNNHLTEMLKAIYEDGCQIKAYTAWTLMDDFEWMSGYSQKFGLHYVDFNDPERKRTPKKSAHFFKEVIRSRKLPDLTS